MDQKRHIFFHIDVNSAFLSWTSVRNLETGQGPDLRLIPAVIGGDESTRHGIVLAKSVPAKKYGIHTADTLSSARAACPGLVVASPDFQVYRNYSHALMDYLRTVSPEIEQASIDECYMDYTAKAEEWLKSERKLAGTCPPAAKPVNADRIDAGDGDTETEAEETALRTFLVERAHEIKDHVREKFAFTVNVGISDRKVLAKMASDFEKPDKVHTLFVDEIEEKMWPLPVDELFMAGKSAAQKLHLIGIQTIGDLARTDPRLLEAQLMSHGRMLWEFANGIDRSRVETARQDAKGIGSSTTVSSDIETSAQAYEVLRGLAEEVGRRLRKDEKRAENVCVEIKYADFHRTTRQKMLSSPIESDERIYREACGIFDESWTGKPARLLGIRLTKLTDRTAPVQLSLFDMATPQYQQEQEAYRREQLQAEQQAKRAEKLSRLDLAMRTVNSKYGETVVHRGLAADASPGIVGTENKIKKD